MRLPPCAVIWLTLLIVGETVAMRPASAASFARKLDLIFQPDRVEQATLSRDGRHLAFALRDARDVELVVYAVDRPERAAHFRLGAPAGAPVRHLEWIARDRLVAAVDTAAVVVVDASARLVLRLDSAKAFSPPGEKRTGRPVVRVLGATDEPDAVGIEVQWHGAGGDVQCDVLNLNVRTLERRLVRSRKVDSPGGVWMLDRQGRPRLFFSHAGKTRRFYYMAEDGGRFDGQPLDRIVAGASAGAWQVTARNFAGERAFPLGFDRDPQILYFASNVGRDTYGIYALDLRTGAPTGFAVEDPVIDLVDFDPANASAALVMDRARQTLVGIAHPAHGSATRWLDADLAAIQAAIDERFSGRAVRVLEWDDARTQFLVLVTAPIDAGRYFVYHAGDGRCVEYQRNPALPADEANRVEPLTFATVRGEQLTGTVTWPGATAGTKPALVVWLHDGPLQQVSPGFQREAQALAAAGFAVVQINYRGSAGFGRHQRDLIRDGFDRVPLEDALAAITALAERGHIDRARVAVGGEGFGGFLALRALQLHPDVFRGAVAINAPLDLAQLYGHERDSDAFRRSAEQSFRASIQATRELPAGESDGSTSPEAATSAPDLPSISAPPLPPTAGGDDGGSAPAGTFEREFARWFFGPAGRQNHAVMAQVEQLTRPVLLVHDPRNPVVGIAPVRRLRETLVRRKQPVEYLELPPNFASGGAEVRVPLFRRIAEFYRMEMDLAGLDSDERAVTP